jgi:hypothetical protein
MSREMEHLLNRVRREFVEMPGQCLTQQQAQRLWGVNEDVCARVFSTLVRTGFLVHTGDARFMRADRGRVGVPLGHPKVTPLRPSAAGTGAAWLPR